VHICVYMCISFKYLFIAFIIFIITCILSSRFCLCSFKLLKIFAHYKHIFLFALSCYCSTHSLIFVLKGKREREIYLAFIFIRKKLIISFSGIFSLCWWNDFHITFWIISLQVRWLQQRMVRYHPFIK
jgi:hypothetical protein